ncbi:MAG: hypothetical protein ACTS2F_28390 [Thainema sp.]
MSSGPYQSRLLNFLLRQSRQLADKSSETARRLKIATVWGAQAMLYPIYALFQTTRIAGKQLGPVGRFMARFQLGSAKTADTNPDHPSANSEQPNDAWLNDDTEIPTLPAPDAPVFNVLQAIKALSLPKVQQRSVKLTVQATQTLDGQPAAGILDMPDSAELATQRTQIRGIASQLLNRALVLISDRNEIIDVLSNAQQQQLRTRIIWELEQYDHQIQQVRLLGQTQIRAEALPGNGIRGLLPVRRFQQLMAWVQQSPMAVGLNIFQESALLPSPIASPQTALPRTVAQSLRLPVPDQLDYTMARLEAADISPIVDSTTSLFQRGKAWFLKHFNRSLSSELAVSHVSDANSKTAPANPDPAQDWELYAPKPSMPPSWLAKLAQPRSLIRRSQPAGSPEMTEPNLDELSQKVRSHIANNRRPSSPYSQSAAIFSFGASLTAPTETQSQSTNRTTQRTEAAALTNPQPTPMQSSSTATTTPSAGLSHPEQTSVPDVTWLEAKVSFVGYVKHPLERILEWLDRIMLWLEDRLINLGKWLRQLWPV